MSMIRSAMRRLTTQAVLVGFTLAATALGAGAQQATSVPAAANALKVPVQTAWPQESWLFDSMKFFASRVERMSGGRLVFEGMPAGQVVPPFQLLDGVGRRVVDVAHGFSGFAVGQNKAAILFSGGPGGPFGMDFFDYLGWMHNGGGFALYQEFYRDVLRRDVVAMPIAPLGPQSMGWYSRKIESLADFKGMRCRHTGMAAEIYAEMGMKVINMPGGEVLQAAQRKLIDCAEFNGSSDDLRLGFQNVWKYHYYPALHEPVVFAELLFNGEFWRGLSPDLQEIIRAAANETVAVWYPRYLRDLAEAMDTMRTKHNVNVMETPQSILVETLKAWDRIALRESEKNAFFKKVYDSQKEWARNTVPQKRLYAPPQDLVVDHYWGPRKR